MQDIMNSTHFSMFIGQSVHKRPTNAREATAQKEKRVSISPHSSPEKALLLNKLFVINILGLMRYILNKE